MNLKTSFDINQSTIYIDVRSESEFEQGHIIGAINMPILNDEERHIVGHCYKNKSVEEAKRLGLTYASHKVVQFFDLISEIKADQPESHIFFYCARGGFRSRSITYLLSSIGVDVKYIEGGYKTYRQHVLSYLEKPSNYPEFIMLHGFTGVGKTEILKALEASKKPILDLEGLANHKGSHLGAIGTNEKQSQQLFENGIYHHLAHLKASYCFIESESKRIGNVFVPKILFGKMREGQHILIKRDMPFRVSSLCDEYCRSDNFKKLVEPALLKIKKYLSKQVFEELENALKQEQYALFAELLLIHHYDPIYLKSINNYIYPMTFNANHVEKVTREISEWYDLIQSN